MLQQRLFGRSGLALLAVAALLSFSCAVEHNGTDTNSGGDHKRDLAKKIPLGRSVTDSVSAPKGDHTDWKYIDVPEDGTLKITVSIDNPQVSGVVMIYDELGEPIQRATINAKDNTYDFDLPVEGGKKLYIKVAVTAYETVYSVGNTFQKKEAAAVVAITPTEEPKPRPVFVAEPKPKHTTPTKEEPAAEDPAKVVVTSVILAVIPWKEGKATRITFKQGSEQGIKRGASVDISSGGSCIVKDVYPVTSVCYVDKLPETFKEGTKVVITSDR